MKNQKPLVSILLPVHNSEKFLRESLQSLVSQSFRNIEIIALDDQSKDNSYKILKTFNKNYKKVRAYRNVKRYGIVITLNRLMRRARGEFIAFMDADDIAHRQRVKKQVKFLTFHPEIVALGTQCSFINKNGKKIKGSHFPKENNEIYTSPLHGLSLQFETVMINKNLLPKDLLRFEQGAGVFIYSDFLIKLLPYGKFANLGNYLYYHRNDPKTYIDDLLRHILSFTKLCLRSSALHDYEKALNLFFKSLVKPFPQFSTFFKQF